MRIDVPSSLRKKELQEQFLKHGFSSLTSRERMELFLSYSRAGTDSERFSDLSGPGNALLFGIMKSIYTRVLEERLIGKSIRENSGSLLRFARLSIGSSPVESGMVIFADADFRMTGSEIAAVGTIDNVWIYPRIVLSQALRRESSFLILLHNHPGGSLRPSEDDLRYTDTMSRLCDIMNVRLVDHLIVTRNSSYSIFSGREINSVFENQFRFSEPAPKK